MEFYSVVNTRRSIRKFRQEEIPCEILSRILGAGRAAPSASRPYEVSVVAVKDPGRRAALASLCNGQSFMASAPVIIAVCARNVKKNRGGYMGEYGMLVDGAIVADHIILAARAEGLATCWIGSFDNAGIKEFLELPRDINVVALTPVGYPADEGSFSQPENKKCFEEMVHFEKWQE